MAHINYQEVNYAQLSKIQKLSVFLIAIGPKAAATMLRTFDDNNVETLCREISHINIVDQELKDQVLEEFASILGQSVGSVLGGPHITKKELEMSQGDHKASNILERILPGGSVSDLIQDMSSMEPRQIYNLMAEEQSQTIAFLISHLDTQKAAEVLELLPKEHRDNVAECIGTMDSAPLEMVAKIVQALKPHIASAEKYTVHKSGGVRVVADVLNFLGKEVSKSILSKLEDKNPSLGAAIRKKMFSFDDLVRLDPVDLQRVTREIEMSDLVLAMKSAHMLLQDAIFKSVSKRAAESIKEEMEMLGAVRLKDVDAAQDRIIQVLRRLEEEGEITLDDSGGNVVV